jgi:hypothetical protein
MRVLLNLAAFNLIMAGSFAPMGVSQASAPREVAARPRVNDVSALRGEAPHLELKSEPRPAAPGEEVTVTGRLRGYNLGSSDFCLAPKWVVFGTLRVDGARVEIPIEPQDVQCRDHSFKRGFTFVNAGLYGLALELRTQGTKARLQERAEIFVEIGGR